MDKLKKILAKYSSEDAKQLKVTIEELSSKGIGKGCFQDYGMLADVIEMMYSLVSVIEKGELTQ